MEKVHSINGISIPELNEAVTKFMEKYSPFAEKALLGLAITDGRHPSYFVSFSGKKFSIYMIQTPKLEVDGPLFPIGAGDAVAGGTLAAWLSLTCKEDNDTALSDTCNKVLQDRFKENNVDISDPNVKTIVDAFAFGLACGSASKLSRSRKTRLFLIEAFVFKSNKFCFCSFSLVLLKYVISLPKIIRLSK